MTSKEIKTVMRAAAHKIKEGAGKAKKKITDQLAKHHLLGRTRYKSWELEELGRKYWTRPEGCSEDSYRHRPRKRNSTWWHNCDKSSDSCQREAAKYPKLQHHPTIYREQPRGTSAYFSPTGRHLDSYMEEIAQHARGEVTQDTKDKRKPGTRDRTKKKEAPPIHDPKGKRPMIYPEEEAPKEPKGRTQPPINKAPAKTPRAKKPPTTASKPQPRPPRDPNKPRKPRPDPRRKKPGDLVGGPSSDPHKPLARKLADTRLPLGTLTETTEESIY
ncbi:hypothetical protein M406DRAFT_74871 [Cryphonectria parasitica EP155]|uniref:Uncharacterized protein n=1 Tax=Cryphonectria parasitica (strain ATCC 38755 / EP155) TaxID=660469 RepID=A0A9P4XW02_CRYP1|nr:uncharacterized protein M406DRAFT_74871 [Cryphonectria parasitica EP155]KAF3761948.1 hypothetical protein M406DRAFT_74871 [Cryphonectria parasitica EP155]